MCRIDIEQREAGVIAEHMYDERKLSYDDTGCYPSWSMDPITGPSLREVLIRLVEAGHGDRLVTIWPEMVETPDGMGYEIRPNETAKEALARLGQ